MKQQYDFSKGKRGRIQASEPDPPGKLRITIRIDEDIIDAFLKESQESAGAVGYQTLINHALRQHVEGKAPKLEDTLRRVLRDVLRDELGNVKGDARDSARPRAPRAVRQ
jgi:uncharacterized protein (DUF4415 family)